MEYRNHLAKNKKTKQINSSRKTTTAEITKKQKRPVSQEQFDKDLLNYIINSMTHLRNVEDPYFESMIHNLNINEDVQVPNRKSFGKKLAHHQFKQQCKFKEKIAAANHVYYY